MQTTPTKSVELSLNTLRVLLFGDTDLEGLTPQSKISGDTAKVVIIPAGIGLKLSKIDDAQVFFHVEIYPTHAEVWLPVDWIESNARRSRQRERSRIERESYNREQARLHKVKEHLRKKGYGLRPDYLDHISREIIAAWNAGHIKEMSKMVELLDLLNILNEKDEANEATQTTADQDQTHSTPVESSQTLSSQNTANPE